MNHPPQQPPDPAVVQTLENALAAAKAGQLGSEVVVLARLPNDNVGCFFAPLGISSFAVNGLLGAALDFFRSLRAQQMVQVTPAPSAPPVGGGGRGTIN